MSFLCLVPGPALCGDPHLGCGATDSSELHRHHRHHIQARRRPCPCTLYLVMPHCTLCFVMLTTAFDALTMPHDAPCCHAMPLLCHRLRAHGLLCKRKLGFSLQASLLCAFLRVCTLIPLSQGQHSISWYNISNHGISLGHVTRSALRHAGEALRSARGWEWPISGGPRPSWDSIGLRPRCRQAATWPCSDMHPWCHAPSVLQL